jgi:hypothetical protein
MVNSRDYNDRRSASQSGAARAGGSVESMSTDNTLAAAEQLPVGANAGASPGQADARPIRPKYGLRILVSGVKRMSYLLQGNVMQYRELVGRLQDPI